MRFLVLALLLLSTSVFADRKNIDEKSKKEVLEILNQNDVLFNALLKKDGKVVEKEAKILESKLQKIQTPILKDVVAQKSQLNAMKAAASNEAHLKSYEVFLNPLISVVQNYNVGDKFNVFYCPMVKKSWLQNIALQKDVRNVYATYMLECGEQTSKF